MSDQIDKSQILELVEEWREKQENNRLSYIERRTAGECADQLESAVDG